MRRRRRESEDSPQALQSGLPSVSRRQSGVFVAPQLVHTWPPTTAGPGDALPLRPDVPGPGKGVGAAWRASSSWRCAGVAERGVGGAVLEFTPGSVTGLV